MKSKIISAAIAAFMLTTGNVGINVFAAEPPAETSVQVTATTDKADNEKAKSKNKSATEKTGNTDKKETEEKDNTEKSEKNEKDKDNKNSSVTTISKESTQTPANETIQGASKAGVANKAGSADSSKNNADKKAEKKSSDDTSSVSETDKSDDYREQVVSALKSGKGIANKSKDFSSDEHYDTKGNATLIKSEQIIFDSDKMQFISVTTKDGHVFYVLINYTASQGEDNVFFLNKVDDLDLYALLYESDDDSSKMTPEEAKQAAAKASGKTVSEDNSGTDKAKADSSAENPTKKKAVSNKSSMYMLIGILAIGGIGGIGGVGFVLMRKKKGRNGANAVSGSEIQENEENIYDEDDDEFGYDDDDEQDD